MDFTLDINTIEHKLKNTLSEKRYIHSLGVRDEACRLAVLYGADKDKAYVAGLIHDCAKHMEFSESIALCGKYNIKLDDITRRCPAIIHAPVGAVLAESEYGINDREILDAVRYHTVAREKMTLLDKIIYVADMTEPNRDFDGVDRLRQESREDIDLAYKNALGRSIIYNISKGNAVHPNTLYAWNEMCNIE